MKKLRHIKTWPWTAADNRESAFRRWVVFLAGCTIGALATWGLLMALAYVMSGCATPQSGPDCTAWRKVDDEWECKICRIPGGEHRICQHYRTTDAPWNYDDSEAM